MIEKLLPTELFFQISEQFSVRKITEIRIRGGSPVTVAEEGVYSRLYEDGKQVIANKELLDAVMSLASGNSMYAVSDLLLSGYLSCEGGVRVGVGGEGVREGGRVAAVKNINSVCIRIPHQIKGCLASYGQVVKMPANTLIVSRPGAGKTTYLRELTRLVSNSGKNCLLIDERGELAACRDGVPMLDVGDSTDIFTAIPKAVAYENAVRSMSPEIIVTDEIFGEKEIEAVADIARAGVLVFASVHAKYIAARRGNKLYKELLDMFRYVFLLDKTPRPGTVVSFDDRGTP
jgi:stage III sporulation protein AA